MKKEMFVLIFVVLVLSISLISAIDTNIRVKTKAKNEVDIRIYTPKMEKLDEYIGEIADSNGEINLVHSSNRDEITITTFIGGMEEGGLNFFRNITTGRQVFIDLNKGVPSFEYLDTPETNETSEGTAEENTTSGEQAQEEIQETDLNEETEVQETTSVEEQEVEKSSVTGNVIIENGKKVLTSKITYFIIIGLVLVVVALFIAKKKLKSKKGTYINFRLTAEDDPKISDAEEKLKQAKEELDEIKNRRGKIDEAKERLEKAKEELKRLGADN